MSFVLAKLAWAVLQPSNLLVLGLVVALLLGWRRAALGLVAVVVAVVVLPVGAWLLQPLEDRFPRPAGLPETVTGIIVLGGAQQSQLGRARGVLALNQHAERLVEGLALAYRHPEAVLVFSGWSASLVPDASEREVNELFLELLRFDGSRVRHEERSRNTWENAVQTRALVQPQPDEVWVLVTSAAHMPRAVGMFRTVGFPVVPWPVDYQTTGAAGVNLRPDTAGGLAFLDDAVREWLALLAYRLMGRTDRLLPAP